MRRALLLVSAAVAALAPGYLAGEECGVCHPESRVAFAHSLHAAEEVTCVSCHGGDPDSRDADKAHRGSYRSLADRRLVPAMCAECHANLERMRPYNLPVHQYAVYQTSRHGIALAGGDTRAAVCTDCHGVHDLRSASDPASLAHPRNLADTCGRCHGDQALMERYDLDPGIVDSYRAGVHWQSLSGGNTAAPSCTDCHGVHGAAPPDIGNVDKVCGSCHAQARRAFLEGPHYQGMLDADLPECASCHSNHEVVAFVPGESAAVCAECHEEGSAEAEVGLKIQHLIESAAAEVDKAEALVEEGRQVALEIEDHLSRIEEARTYLTESYPLAHAVRLEPVEEMTRRARSIGEEVQHELYEKLDRRPAHIGLAVFWFYVVMTLAILLNYKRRLLRATAE